MDMTDSRLRRRADRVKKEVSISRLLHDFGYPVRPDAGDREQQFACDLHGDGQDNKPSARVYPESNSWYCFGCDKNRDTIETVREYKGIGFIEAVEWLEEKFNLEPLEWLPGDKPGTAPPPQKTDRDHITERIDTSKTFEDDIQSMTRLLDRVTKERTLSMDDTTAFWEGFDKLRHLVNKNLLPEDRARAALAGIKKRVMETLIGGAS